jgi:hypothetical protein
MAWRPSPTFVSTPPNGEFRPTASASSGSLPVEPLLPQLLFGISLKARPAFVAPIYPGGEEFKNDVVPADAPPMFITAATDDQLGVVPESVALFQKWTQRREKRAKLNDNRRAGLAHIIH